MTLKQMISGCGAGGSALPWGGRGRKFKSCHSDQKSTMVLNKSHRAFCFEISIIIGYREFDQSKFVEVSMIVPVDETNLLQAATIHSISWKESHRAFCTPDFIETHTPDRQREYLRNKMNNGTKLYMLVEEKPIGVVSVTKGLIEDLYILPDMQNMGHGTKLLLYAVGQCTDTPTLWILENNINAERLYRRIGFKETGRKNAITNKLDEIEFALT